MVDLISPRRGEFFTHDGEPTKRFITWIENLTTTTNTTVTEIVSDKVREVFPWDYSDTSAVDQVALQSLYSSMIPEVKQWRAVTATQNYTALDHDFVNATRSITVKFPQYPPEGAAITIRNGDGSSIKLDGNGKKLNSETTGIINRKGTAIDFYYFIDSGEWFAR